MDIDAEVTKLSPTEKDVVLITCGAGTQPDVTFEKACQSMHERFGCMVVVVQGADGLHMELMSDDAKRQLLNELRKSLTADGVSAENDSEKE
jgi:hypothetical protein